MFTKIHLKFYDVMFYLCGIISKYYWAKAEKEKAINPNGIRWHRYERKAWKYIDIREDILEIEYALKGLI